MNYIYTSTSEHAALIIIIIKKTYNVYVTTHTFHAF